MRAMQRVLELKHDNSVLTEVMRPLQLAPQLAKSLTVARAADAPTAAVALELVQSLMSFMPETYGPVFRKQGKIYLFVDFL